MTDDVVTVLAPARLHLGFLDPGGSLGRRFGGVGLAIDAPATTLRIARAARDTVTGEEAERARAYLGLMREALGLTGRHALTVDTVMPAHAGFGSGTQLALAVAGGLRRLEGLPPDPAADAALLGRGHRSGLGVAFVEGGGVAVDGGKGASEEPPPLIARLPFPEAWRVILVMDPRGAGFHGQAELDAFATLPPFPVEHAGRICRLVLMQALPGLAETDLHAFGSAIGEIQAMVGSHFAPAQGGVFTSPRVAAACGWLAANGAHGIGQSSWGPTGFAFAESRASAESLVARLAETGLAEALDVRVVGGRNRGIDIGAAPAVRLRAGTG
ncbi:beta-ribofuranosylaminobenzene 5'-phosphate synthase family protein [Jiella sonneratiae]|uniref:GHMP kinase n=1 Tax=Jiella sonneratiae TaxID=2816856 RepID=A0ABS3J0Z6_9HYPH|nr:beta-ribofuranosylaminobenzene 5'-phosphate synthase family protein [Jiella sonneratiae]MBO0902648.1 GHMP kinase [Jiella sonneratiae]